MTYPWGDTRRFNSYAGYFRRLFGCRVQKLSVDAGFTCPNRDGTIGEGGCTFCNNGAFTPSYCMPSKSVGQQIAEGIEFHRNRYRSAQRYLVYFQAFSNTYAPLERLKRLYDEALAHPGVAGIVLAALQFAAMNGLLSSSFVYALGNTLIYAIVAIGFCLLLGYSGLASLGTAGFIGLGSYTAFYLIQEMGAPYSVALLATLVISIGIGVVVGFISLRIEGIYLAIMTLALAEVIRNALMALKSTIKIDITNVYLFGVNVNENAVYLLITFTFILLMLLTSNLIRSPIGRAMIAMKSSTSAAQAMGVSLMKYRLMAFVISTINAALGGLLYMLYVRNMTTATSTLLTLSTSLNILGAVIIGGAKSLWGTAFGTFVIYGLQSMFLSKIQFFIDNPAFITMVTGVLIIVVVMFFPGGFAQMVVSLRSYFKKRSVERRLREYGKD